jgi:hypothetical protein
MYRMTVACLQEELQRERDERNYYQMERDRIDTFWEVTRRELGTLIWYGWIESTSYS